MRPLSRRLRGVPVIGDVFDLAYVGPVAERAVDFLPLVLRGAVCGFLAFLTGYRVLLWGVTNFMPRLPGWLQGLLDFANISLPTHETIAGWAFYMAHGFQIEYTAPFKSGTKSLAGTSGELLFLFPPLLLVLAGAIAAGTQPTLLRGAIAGASVVIGYAYPFIDRIGGFYWQHDVLWSEVAVWIVQGENPMDAAIRYPLIFGTLGGLLMVGVFVPMGVQARRTLLARVPVLSRFA